MHEVLAVGIGYLLGSILPAYVLGRARGIDLRTEGDHNAGTTNVYHVLGLWPAVLTAIYDVFKGLLAMLIAWQLGVAQPWTYAAGLAAVVGHRFPVWLGFRGAQGMAASVGLLFYCLVTAILQGWLTWASVLAIAALVGLVWAAFHSGTATGVVVMPVLAATIARHANDVVFVAFMLLVVGYIWLVNVRLAIEKRSFHLGAETRSHLKHLRVVLRPLALVFPILYLFVDKRDMLLLVGSVTLFFIALDTARIVSPSAENWLMAHAGFFFRKAEARRYTSATLFLTGSFLTLFLYPKPAASLALVFAIAGDLIAKYVGMEHGRIAIGGRTLEGSLGYFLACALCGALWSQFVPLTAVQVLVGSGAAALTEALPVDLDDNFTVPLISGAVMTIPAYFGVPGF